MVYLARLWAAVWLLILLFSETGYCGGHIISSSKDDDRRKGNNFPIISFDEGYSHLFGDENLMVVKDGKDVHLSLDERTGAGFMSHDLYLHGFFSASIKLPSDYTAGVVVAFYMSNGDMYEKMHDEIDVEFLGNIRGKDWRIQTNVYGNGSTSVGREERYTLWFDPSEEFHNYSILWTQYQIIFYVDNVPIREMRKEAMGRDFPSKPMTLYATIWDGSDWATNGGKYRVNYKYAPYVARFSDLVLHGCAVDPTDHGSFECSNNHVDHLSSSIGSSSSDVAAAGGTSDTRITSKQRVRMEDFRRKHMTYSYCYDRLRYKQSPAAECVFDPVEAERLRRFDPVTFGGGEGRGRRGRHRHHHRGRRNVRSDQVRSG